MLTENAYMFESSGRVERTSVVAAESAGDVATTADVVIRCIDTHEKTAWMLRATAS